MPLFATICALKGFWTYRPAHAQYDLHRPGVPYSILHSISLRKFLQVPCIIILYSLVFMLPQPVLQSLMEGGFPGTVPLLLLSNLSL